MRARGAAPAVIGVFGGSFDPPHLGHALLPTWLQARGLVDHLVVAPCAVHPLGKPLRPFWQRLAWTRAAMRIHGNAVTVSAIEAELHERARGPSYTLDLLRAVAARHGESRIRLVIGSDIARETAKWRGWDEIARDFDPLFVPRTGHAPSATAVLPEVSSTAVREALSAGDWDAVATGVPASVLEQLRRPIRGCLGIVGSGHVGSHAAPWAAERGFEPVVISARRLAEALPPKHLVGMWLTARDAALPRLAAALCGRLTPGTPVLHAAGALRSAAVLAPLREAGHPVGTLHPICAVRKERLWPSPLASAAFGVEGDEEARALALALVHDAPIIDLQGLGPSERDAYHGACALLANHIAVLHAAASGELTAAAGASRPAVAAGLGGLLQSAVDNLRALGIPHGLTGPLVRGDEATVRRHIAALGSPGAELYRVLSEALSSILRTAPDREGRT